MSFDNLYDENAQQQATEFNPVRISDGVTFPSLFDADRFKVFDAVSASGTTSLISGLTLLNSYVGNNTSGSVNQQLSSIRNILTQTHQLGYHSGDYATGLVFNSGESILSLTAVNTSNNQVGTISINGGDTIEVDSGESFAFESKKGYLINPTITISNNLRWYVDWVI